MKRQIAVELVVIGAIGVGLALLGPFGSYVLPLSARLLFWVGNILAGYAIFRPLLVVGAWLSKAAAISATAANLIVLTLGAIPLTFLILRTLTSLGEAAAPPAHFTVVYAQVWGIGLAITLFMNRFFAPRHLEAPERAGSAPPEIKSATPRLLDRLPPSFGERVLCLEMEDHYVRVHGDGGSVLLLMRLNDSISELEGVEGMRVHRSWWVARDAVTGTLRRGRGLALLLSNGIEVPVSRSYADAVKSARLPGDAAAANQPLSWRRLQR
ncbi:MAG TPA: LytTR family DNA-binding domain-containing protein [Allosphingosinicella sp.]|nr:LytTR family DNA-binding domain-containing protein [Allosphingosinicella sp.]